MEELIIRVKIDGMGGGTGRDSQQGRSAIRNENGALAAGAIGAALQGKKEYKKPMGKAEKASFSYLRKLGYDIQQDDIYSTDILQQKQKIFSMESEVRTHLIGVRLPIDQTVNTFAGSSAHQYLVESQRRFKALGSAIAYKTVSSAVAVHQHKSGDSYANAQLNNMVKLAGYGTMLAISGPAAPFVAAGIAVNEIANGIVEGINYRFDRALEGNQIRNMKIIAGDVSYGRRRGAL